MLTRRELLLALGAAWMYGCGTDAPAPAVDPAPLNPEATFHRIYRDPELRERFFPFLQNIFHLYPPDKLHDLIHRAAEAHGTDEAIYRAIAKDLPTITPVGSMATFALPALRKQKQVMAAQAEQLLASRNRFDGYLEMGTTGRYVRPLRRRLELTGPVYLLNDAAPGRTPVDLVERGQLAKAGTFLDLGRYEPLDNRVPKGTIGLISNFIGLHHCPLPQLDAFIDSLRRVLRPDGVLLLREHDVTDPTMDTIAALAHDVFNAGTDATWSANQAEIRHFRSVADWQTRLEAHGFRREDGALRQEGDPTRNVLLRFGVG